MIACAIFCCTALLIMARAGHNSILIRDRPAFGLWQRMGLRSLRKLRAVFFALPMQGRAGLRSIQELWIHPVLMLMHSPYTIRMCSLRLALENAVLALPIRFFV